MNQELTIAIIGISSALLGSIVGGAISYFSNLSIKTQEWTRTQKRQEIQDKKTIYSQFLKEAYNLRVKAIGVNQICNLSEFNELTFHFSQIEIISSEALVKVARDLYEHVVHSHNPDKETPENQYATFKTKFIIAVKQELSDIKNT